jgi:sec-independent protein translocase protein TatC
VAAPSAKPPSRPEDDDEIEASRAPLLDHLLELRGRLIVALVAIGVGFVISFIFARPLYLVLVEPFREAAEQVRGVDAEQLRLIYTAPFEFFFVKVKLALFGGIILAFPVIAHQVYRFIAPGLYRRERATVLPYLLASPLLFAAGAALVYYFVLPFAMRFALGQETTIEGGGAIELLPRVSDYLALVTTLILAFGFAFQMPVVMSLAGRAGLISAKQLRKGRRYAIVGIFVFAAFVTPPDPFSQTILGLSIMALYELSILAVWVVEKRRKQQEEAEETAEQAAAGSPASSQPGG